MHSSVDKLVGCQSKDRKYNNVSVRVKIVVHF